MLIPVYGWYVRRHMSSDDESVTAVPRRNTLELQEETVCGAVKATVSAPGFICFI